MPGTSKRGKQARVKRAIQNAKAIDKSKWKEAAKNLKKQKEQEELEQKAYRAEVQREEALRAKELRAEARRAKEEQKFEAYKANKKRRAKAPAEQEAILQQEKSGSSQEASTGKEGKEKGESKDGKKKDQAKPEHKQSQTSSGTSGPSQKASLGKGKTAILKGESKKEDQALPEAKKEQSISETSGPSQKASLGKGKTAKLKVKSKKEDQALPEAKQEQSISGTSGPSQKALLGKRRLVRLKGESKKEDQGLTEAKRRQSISVRTLVEPATVAQPSTMPVEPGIVQLPTITLEHEAVQPPNMFMECDTVQSPTVTLEPDTGLPATRTVESDALPPTAMTVEPEAVQPSTVASATMQPSTFDSSSNAEQNVTMKSLGHLADKFFIKQIPSDLPMFPEVLPETSIEVVVNHLKINHFKTLHDTSTAYLYNCLFKPRLPKRLLRHTLQFMMPPLRTETRFAAFDGRQILYSPRQLFKQDIADPKVEKRNVNIKKYIQLEKPQQKFRVRIAPYWVEDPSGERRHETLDLTNQLLLPDTTYLFDLILRQYLISEPFPAGQVPDFITSRYQQYGKSFYSRLDTINGNDTHSLGGGFQCRRGIYQNVYGTHEANFFLNINVVHLSFTELTPIMKCMENVKALYSVPNHSTYREALIQDGVSYEELHELNNVLHGLMLKFEIPNRPDSARIYKLFWVFEESAHEITLQSIRHKNPTIAEYFQKAKGCPLQYPQLPVLLVGNSKWTRIVPPEFCTLLSGQVINWNLNDAQTRKMVSFAATHPSESYERIIKAIPTVLQNTDWASEFGLKVSNELHKVKAKVLQPLALEFGDKVKVPVEKGKWQYQKFQCPQTLTKWFVLILNQCTDIANEVVNIQDPNQVDVQEDIQAGIQEANQDNIEADIQEANQVDVQPNIQDYMQDPNEEDAQENIQADIQEAMQVDVEPNIQGDMQEPNQENAQAIIMQNAIKESAYKNHNHENIPYPDNLTSFIQEMKRVGITLGMQIDDPLDSHTFVCHYKTIKDERLRRKLASIFTKMKNDAAQLVLVVIPKDLRKHYSTVKLAAEIDAGILTQCVMQETITKQTNSKLVSILLKINTKLNGTNHVVRFMDQQNEQHQPEQNEAQQPGQDEQLQQTQCPEQSLCSSFVADSTMHVGADIIYPPHLNYYDVPAVAAVVASHDPHGMQYNMQWRLQDHGKMDKFFIVDLEQMMKEQILTFIEKTGQRPSRILFYRKTIWEVWKYGIDEVFQKEIDDIRAACRSIEEGYRPTITYLVVERKHQVKFFYRVTTDDKEWALNVPPGTIVSSDIIHTKANSFYLVSHGCKEGTARPAYYYYILDENNLREGELHKLAYYSCHQYCRCTRSVSCPAPTYYAGLAAARIRVYLRKLQKIQTPQELMNDRQIKYELLQNSPMFFV